MSVDQLLLLLFLIGIPLLERLIRVMRERTSESAAERASGSEPAVARRRPRSPADDANGAAVEAPRVELPRAAPPAPPAAPDTARPRIAEQLRATERERTRLQRERQRAPSARQRVIAVGDLRRAIVLTEILGPCRALERDWKSQ
jgi:hypothetical protein